MSLISFSRPTRFALISLVSVVALTGALTFGAAPGGAAPTCTMTYTKTTGGNFLTAANWDVNRIPMASDYACIPAGTTGKVTFSGASTTIAGFDAEGSGGFAVASGTLTVTDTANASIVNSPFSFSGGTITGAGGLVLNGQVTWAGGALTGAGPTTVGASAVLTDTNANNWSGGVILQRALTNHGTITLPAGDALNFQGGVTLTNASDGTIDLHGDNARLLPGNGSGGTVVNTGHITRSLGANTVTIGVPITTSLSKLTLASGTGTLSMTAGGNLSGTSNLPAGTILSFDSGNANNWVMTGVTINGPGVTRLNPGFNGNTWTLSGTTTVNSPFSFSGGTITGAGGLVLNGQVTWAGGALTGAGPTTVGASAVLTDTNANNWSGGVILQRALTNHGTITLPAGDALNFQGGVTLTNASDGTIDLHGDNARLLPGNGSGGTVVNTGHITRSLGANTVTIGVPITTSLSKLTLASGTGTLSMTAGGNLSGTSNLPAGTILSFDSGNANNWVMTGVTINGPGVTRLNPGFNGNTWTLSGTTTVNSPFSFSGGTITGAGGLVLNGQVTWAGGALTGAGPTTVGASAVLTDTNANNWSGGVILQRALTNHGTITLPAGDALNFQGGVTLTNASDGTIDLHGDNARLLPGNGSGGTVVNTGHITRSLGANTVTIGVPVNNKTTGVIDLGTGTLEMSSGLTNSGLVNVRFRSLHVTGGMTSTGTAVLAIGVGPSSHGDVTVAATNVLAGELHINLQSGYTPVVGTAVQLITTSGTQTGAFKAGAYQVIGATNTGWKFAVSGNKVVATVKPLSDVSAAISGPPGNATQTIPFNVSIKVKNNGPTAANSATVTLTMPASVHVSGALPAGCTQPTATTVRCAAGTVAVSATTTFTISLVANSPGNDTLTAAAGTANTDIDSTNNKQSTSVTVV